MINLKVLSTAAILALTLPVVLPSASFAQALPGKPLAGGGGGGGGKRPRGRRGWRVQRRRRATSRRRRWSTL